MKDFLYLLSDEKYRWVVLALSAGLIFFAYSNGTRLRTDPMLYAAIARTMADSGDYTSLRLYDEPYYLKPPLLFWLSALMIKIFGPIPFAVTLFSRIFGLGSVLLTGWLGCRLFNARVGWASAFVLLSTHMFVYASTTFRLESALIFGILLSLFAYLNGERKWGPPLFYAGVAIGFLAKGPPGVLPLFLAPLHSLLSGAPRSWNRKFFRWLVWSPSLLMALACWGYILLKDGSGSVAILIDDLVRYKTDGVPRISQFWDEYVLGFAFNYWPWLPFAVAGTWMSVRVALDARQRRDARASSGLLLGWIGITFLSCAVKNAQYLRYALLAIPAISIVAGVALVRCLGDRYFDWLPRVVGSAALIAVVALPCFPLLARETEREQYSAIGQMLDRRYPPGEPIPVLVWTDRNVEIPNWYYGDKARVVFFLNRSVRMMTVDEIKTIAAAGPFILLIRTRDYAAAAKTLSVYPLIEGLSFVLAEMDRSR
jgi:4-amino-4-deoxy-L-arabinose transferase-like glycosyltransferase